MKSEPKIRSTILLKNRKWREGQPEDKKYVNFQMPEDVFGSEVRQHAQCYSIYFDRREVRERVNPTSDGTIIAPQEERVSHTEVFFNFNNEEILTWIKHTEWTPVLDKSAVESAPHIMRSAAHS